MAQYIAFVIEPWLWWLKSGFKRCADQAEEAGVVRISQYRGTSGMHWAESETLRKSEREFRPSQDSDDHSPTDRFMINQAHGT